MNVVIIYDKFDFAAKANAMLERAAHRTDGTMDWSVKLWRVDWLERWTTRRQVQEAALAVWDGGSTDTRLARATPELSQFALRHGLSLVFDDNALVGNKSLMVPSDRQKPEVSLTPTLQHIPEQPVCDDYLHWVSTIETRYGCNSKLSIFLTCKA